MVFGTLFNYFSVTYCLVSSATSKRMRYGAQLAVGLLVAFMKVRRGRDGEEREREEWMRTPYSHFPYLDADRSQSSLPTRPILGPHDSLFLTLSCGIRHPIPYNLLHSAPRNAQPRKPPGRGNQTDQRCTLFAYLYDLFSNYIV